MIIDKSQLIFILLNIFPIEICCLIMKNTIKLNNIIEFEESKKEHIKIFNNNITKIKNYDLYKKKRKINEKIHYHRWLWPFPYRRPWIPPSWFPFSVKKEFFIFIDIISKMYNINKDKVIFRFKDYEFYDFKNKIIEFDIVYIQIKNEITEFDDKVFQRTEFIKNNKHTFKENNKHMRKKNRINKKLNYHK